MEDVGVVDKQFELLMSDDAGAIGAIRAADNHIAALPGEVSNIMGDGHSIKGEFGFVEPGVG